MLSEKVVKKKGNVMELEDDVEDRIAIGIDEKYLASRYIVSRD